MANIFDVAKYILSQTGQLSTMKLQKLCYYAQAWTLVWDEQPLFEEDFEAWINGPVCRELFKAAQGKFTVTPEDIAGNIQNLSVQERDNINRVIEFYGDKEATWLSQLTHMERPWQIARQGLPACQKSTNIITKESIMEYYSEIYYDSLEKTKQ